MFTMSVRLTPICRMAARAVGSQQQQLHLHLRPSVLNMASIHYSSRTLPSSSLHILSSSSSSPRYFSTQDKKSETGAKQEKPIIPGVGKGKTSTGIVGLAVEPDWYNVLLTRCQFLLDEMEASDMPETAQYRIDVTKWCNYVIATTKANPDDPEAVEDAVNMGQVEELIELAEDEQIALDVYLECRMWEMVEEANKTFSIVFNADPMMDPMGPDGDPAVQEQIRKGNEEVLKEYQPKNNKY